MPLIGLNQNFIHGKTVGTVPTGLVRGRPIISNNTVKSEISTLMRGATMALDGPGTPATDFAIDPATWSMLRAAPFNLNVVRLDIRGPADGGPAQLSTHYPALDTVIDNAANNGMYVLLMQSARVFAPVWSELREFWTYAAPRYKNRTHVFYELTNEPAGNPVDFTTALLQEMKTVYDIIRGNAPETLIGVMDFAYPLNTQDALAAIQRAISVGIPIGVAGKCFVATHLYYTDSSVIAGMRNAYPTMATEHVWQSASEDDAFRLGEMERLGISWVSLCGRFPDDTGTDTGGAINSLRDRILPTMHVNGYNWTQDVISASTNALPSGFFFNPRSTFGSGLAAIIQPGAVAGRAFAVSSAIARGTLVGTAGTVTLPKSITLNPTNPGSIQQTSAGSTVSWSTTATTQNITAGIAWAVIASNGVQRGATTNLPGNNSSNFITVQFTTTGDKLRVWEIGNTSINVESGAVTVVAAGVRSITISPMSPGTVAAGTPIQTTVSTTGISSITYVVAESDWSWQSGSNTVAMTPAGQSRVIPVTYTRNGQKFAVFDTDDFNYNLNSNPVIIQAGTGGEPNPEPGNGFYEGFDNNDWGQLTHLWGNTSFFSVSNGVARLSKPAGAYEAAGLMEFPGGADRGHGYGYYEMRVRMSNITGAAALTWPADDQWPGAEEDMGEISADGTFYMAHHWNDNGNDAFELFPKYNFDPTQWFTAGMMLKRDFLEYFVNGSSIGSTTNNVTRVYGDGPNGMNRVFGIMIRSSDAVWIECDWVRFTPGNP